MIRMPYRIAYLATHPIQYQAPLLRELAQCGELDLQVFYLSDFSLHEHYERAFRKSFKWDSELTAGYRWEVLPRTLLGRSTPRRPWLPLRRLAHRLRAGAFDALWVHGWAHIGLCQAIHSAAAQGIPVLFRGESALWEDDPNDLRQRARSAFYRQWLLPRLAALLYIGQRNRQFYLHHGAAVEKLFAMPYAVDNDYFHQRAAAATPERERLRSKLNLESGRTVVLFAGKLVAHKGADELLAAAAILNRQGSAKPYYLFAGDGPELASLRAAAAPLGDAVRFLGFQNQSALPALYDLCDVFVMPSRFEPWGLVVNEAMNAAKPIIASDRVGAAADLVHHGANGFVYPSGNAEKLAEALAQLNDAPPLRQQMGQASRSRIDSWNFSAVRQGLLAALAAVCGERRSGASAVAG